MVAGRLCRNINDRFYHAALLLGDITHCATIEDEDLQPAIGTSLSLIAYIDANRVHFSQDDLLRNELLSTVVFPLPSKI